MKRAKMSETDEANQKTENQQKINSYFRLKQINSKYLFVEVFFNFIVHKRNGS